jgi:uncharacterized protein YlxP (DUF503 family)
MIVGVCELTLHLPECHTLKEKRQVLKSVLARVRNQFSVSIAEVEEQDKWQLARIGMSCVSNSTSHANEILDAVQRYIEESRPDLLITNVETELISW